MKTQMVQSDNTPEHDREHTTRSGSASYTAGARGTPRISSPVASHDGGLIVKCVQGCGISNDNADGHRVLDLPQDVLWTWCVAPADG